MDGQMDGNTECAQGNDLLMGRAPSRPRWGRCIGCYRWICETAANLYILRRTPGGAAIRRQSVSEGSKGNGQQTACMHSMEAYVGPMKPRSGDGVVGGMDT